VGFLELKHILFYLHWKTEIRKGAHFLVTQHLMATSILLCWKM